MYKCHKFHCKGKNRWGREMSQNPQKISCALKSNYKTIKRETFNVQTVRKQSEIVIMIIIRMYKTSYDELWVHHIKDPRNHRGGSVTRPKTQKRKSKQDSS